MHSNLIFTGPVLFRNLLPDELPLIGQLAAITWPATFGSLMPPELVTHLMKKMYAPGSLEQQFHELGHVFLLAEHEGRTLGYLSYETDHGGPSCTMIHKFYLLPAAQGAGIGIRFLSVVGQRALEKGNQLLRLKVYSKNEKAIRFYERHGFRVTSPVLTDAGEGFYVEDLLMEKFIGDAGS